MGKTDKHDLLKIRDSYAEDTRYLIAFLDEHGLELDPEGLRRYVEHLKSAGYKAATVNKRLAAAKNRLRLLFRDSDQAMDALSRFQMESTLKEVRGIKKNTRAVDSDRTLTIKEIRHLIRDGEIPLRIRLFIEFLVATGTRVSEMSGIWLSDVKVEPEYVSVRIVGKGSKERSLKLRHELMSRIRSGFRVSTWLFETEDGGRYDRKYISYCICAAGARIGRRISAHTLRHTFATIQITKNRKVKAVSTYLGHSTTSITQDMYVHEELDLDDLNLGCEEILKK
jgi:integrase/recombinase XerD